jgi:F0F1-type ATP synthase assembly protein I
MTQSDGKRQNVLQTLLIVMIGQVGCLTLVIILLAVLGGRWLDSTFGTSPVFTLVLLIAGIPLSVILMLTIARRTLAKLKAQAEPNDSEPD